MAEHGRRSPDLLPVVAGAVAAIAVALFTVRAFGSLGRAGEVASWALAPVNWLLAGLMAADAGRAAGRAGTPDGRVARRFWLLLCASSVTTGFGGLASGFLDDPGMLLPPVAFVLYVAGLVFLVTALVSLPVPWRRIGGLTTVSLDLAVVFGAAGLMVWYLVTEITHADVSAGTTTLAIALGLLTVCGLIAVAKVALIGFEPIDRGAMRLLSGSTVVCSVAAGGLAVLAPQTGQTPEVVILPLAAMGYLLAARRQRRALAGPRAGHIPSRRRPFSVMPYAAVGLFNVLAVLAELRETPNHEVMLVGSVALTALIISRQITAFRDNARLVSQLDESLRVVRRQEHRFRALVRNSSDVISITDAGGRITYVSPGVEAVLQMTPDEMMGDVARTRIHPEDMETYIEHMRTAKEQPGAMARSEARFQRADGSWRWLEVLSTNLYNDPDIQGMVSNARDVTDARQYREELAYQASHDELTGLVNRTLFVRITDEALAAPEDPERTVVVLVDLDDFKQINDRLGHSVGDALLREVGARLRGGLRPQDTVARLGGDEFAVLLRDVDPAERMDIARRLMDELTRPVTADGYDLLVRASVGVAPGTPGADANELLRRADLAMYVAKGRGRGRCVEFDQGMDLRAREHAQLAAELSVAIDRNELNLVYQPIVTLPEGELSGVEALIRWTHPVRGFVSPAEFIPVAERTGLIVPLGAWVLYEACQQGAAWMRELGPAAPGRISVNVSARQLIEPDFPEVVEAALLASGLPATRLTVEITETAVFDGGPALAAVTAIQALGVKVALDDFGTGHSSLGLLRTCPIDVLKVDKSFVDGVGQSPQQEAIITSLSQIGTAMRLQVIAEGVETAAQAERLHELGYRYAQGFHFARPLKPGEISERVTAPAAA